MTEYTLEQMKANRKLWVEALRSGKYKQGKGVLKNKDGAMCCLGVLAELAGCEWIQGEGAYSADNEVSYAPMRAIYFVGLKTRQGKFDPSADINVGENILTNINDCNTPFARIADIIESEPRGLFIESATP